MLKALASLRITVICLLLLFILTFWGTIAQVENGLYASQERYFSSFFFLAMGFFPFPGAQLVLWVLGINLICGLFNKKLYGWRQIGVIIVHYGLILFLVAAFAIFFDLPISLGISSLNMTLMYLSFFIGALTLAIGRTTLLQGIVHLIIFFEYLFLSLVP